MVVYGQVFLNPDLKSHSHAMAADGVDLVVDVLVLYRVLDYEVFLLVRDLVPCVPNVVNVQEGTQIHRGGCH